MERHAPWFHLVAVVLLVAALVTLAAPPPAQAMDPQLILALASAAGAVALIVGYLIVANSREKQRAASLEGIYTCSGSEANGPMGCGGPAGPEPALARALPEAPMVADGRAAQPAESSRALAHACPGSQSDGPMGCGAPTGSEPSHIASAPAPTVQGQ